jgi:hypothetical protein
MAQTKKVVSAVVINRRQQGDFSDFPLEFKPYAAVAQLVERRIRNA